MPGPVAPWANHSPVERQLHLNELEKLLETSFNKHEAINEMGAELNPNSAVLAPFVLGDPGELEYLVLTARPEHMKSYSGHVSFPGGHLEVSDKDLQSCALRETQEEIGIDSNSINIFGRSKNARTKSEEVLIAPFVGTLNSGALDKAVLNKDEVEFLHVVKVRDLLKPDNYFSEFWDRSETSHLIHIFTVFDTMNRPVFIWGATAQIIFDILSLSFS